MVARRSHRRPMLIAAFALLLATASRAARLRVSKTHRPSVRASAGSGGARVDGTPGYDATAATGAASMAVPPDTGVVGTASQVMAAAGTPAGIAPGSTSVSSSSSSSSLSDSFPATCAPRPAKPKLHFNADCMHMTSHEGTAHGRFNCPLSCPPSTPLAADGKSCKCGPCWQGITCQTPKCAHGEEVGCPNHATHCHHSERVCMCIVGHDGNPHFTGIHCQTKYEPPPPPVLAAPVHVSTSGSSSSSREVCADAPTCKGLSILNKDTCKCECMAPWIGEDCDQCPKCDTKGMVANKDNNCVCSCSTTCENEGYPDEKTCKCNCVNNFGGPTCAKCNKINCENGGEFNEELCACLCPKGWTGKACNECDEATQCENGGSFDLSTCKCKCNAQGNAISESAEEKTYWEGDFCEACTSAAFVDCGAFEFDTSTCRCTDECSGDLECQNGGVLDKDTCQCSCNNGVNVTDPSFLRDARQVAGITFYGGDECETCEPPKEGCPGGRPFNNENCTCTEECANAPLCSGPGRTDSNSVGEGILNNDTCTCDCAPGWGGTECTKVADGSERNVAAVSCQAAMTVIDEGPNAPAKSGLYWINPSGTDPTNNAFQTNCDMSIPGQGWTMLGDIDPSIPVTSEHYANGRNSHDVNSFHILACDEFNGLDGADTELKNVVVRVTIGNVTDYFRPRSGATLCDMLTSQTKHQWWVGGGQNNVFRTPSEVAGSDEQGLSETSLLLIEIDESDSDSDSNSGSDDSESSQKSSRDDENTEGSDEGTNSKIEGAVSEYEWVTPTYVQDASLSHLLGGSNRSWPVRFDGRSYLGFWGGNEAVNGGCCYESSRWFKTGKCSHNEDVLCFDNEECQKDAGEGNDKDVVCKGLSAIGWGKRVTIHLREVLQDYD